MGIQNDEEAEELLKKLSKHYQQPVMPVQRYCEALKTWADCLETAASEDDEAGTRPRFKYLMPMLDDVRLAISKSNLLWRLIYGGEKLRTKKCPEHKGRWSGLSSPDNDCEHGCDFTGWVPDDFVPPKTGGPCRHKWSETRVEGEEPNLERVSECYHCKVELKRVKVE